MKLRRVLLNALLATAIFAIPAAAQTATTTEKTKDTSKSVGDKTADTAKKVGSATKKGSIKVADKLTDKIDINTCSKEDLTKNLEGVGDVTAQKIIDNRPYKSKRELLTKKIVTQSTYEKISPKLVAHGATAKADTDTTKKANK